MTARIGKGIASLVGLGQEAYQHNKEKKQAAANRETAQSSDRLSDSEVEDDEDDWLADDAQDGMSADQADGSKKSDEKGIEWFKKRHPAPPHLAPPTAKLPAPVIIPQKRPRMRTRGFVSAYAPALDACNVEQTAFLGFIDGFQQEITKQGYFNAVNIAVALSVMTYTLSFAPSATVHFTAHAVHLSIEAGRRLYISKKSNSYIDEMNAYYFKPRGLYAMIVSSICSTNERNAANKPR